MTTEKKKRPKLVYKNISEIAHLWIHERQPEARCRNAFYEGDTIYSYGRHFPIARIDKDKKGNKTVLFTLDTYSSTTAQHIRDVASACSHEQKLYMVDVPRYGVPRYGEPRHDVNIKYWTNKIQEALNKIPKARDNKEYYLRAAGSYIQDLQKYLQYYKLKADKDTKKIIKAADPENYAEEIRLFKEKKAKREKYIEDNWDEVQEKKAQDRIKRAKSKRLAEEKKWQEEIDKWRAGESYRIPYKYGGGTLLRYNNSTNRIETSKQVEVPVEAAKRLYIRIQKILKQGGCSDNCSDKILNYTIKTIDPEYLVVGCHSIPMKECDMIAQQLQWV